VIFQIGSSSYLFLGKRCLLSFQTVLILRFQVGNELIRGISGGEKKRACIAMELITAPSVLFLDEPTTGLDASTANAVMVLLKRYISSTE